jgi:outer membrane lipoprotein LolB
LHPDRANRRAAVSRSDSSRRSWTVVGALASVSILAAACATQPAGTQAPPPEFKFVDAPFATQGRMSARHRNDAVAVHFEWTHRPPRDDLVVTTPLGQRVAELTGDASVPRVEVRKADGTVSEAPDWTTLTRQALGFPLPVTGLAAWVRGEPRSGAQYSVETDANGRVAVLRQDGWEVVYDYADAQARMPQRLRVNYPEFEIRVVIDEWQ